MCVQRAAMLGIVEACKKKDAKPIEQVVGFAEDPRAPLRDLSDKIEKDNAGAKILTWGGRSLPPYA